MFLVGAGEDLGARGLKALGDFDKLQSKKCKCKSN